jgi:hypothetical protein
MNPNPIRTRTADQRPVPRDVTIDRTRSAGVGDEAVELFHDVAVARDRPPLTPLRAAAAAGPAVATAARMGRTPSALLLQGPGAIARNARGA